jgi:hypothetical protein
MQGMMGTGMTVGDENRWQDLRAKLEAIAEELADIGRDKLLEALESGRAEPEAEERRLSRARRAVLKAAALLAADEARSDPADEA